MAARPGRRRRHAERRGVDPVGPRRAATGRPRERAGATPDGRREAGTRPWCRTEAAARRRASHRLARAGQGQWARDRLLRTRPVRSRRRRAWPPRWSWPAPPPSRPPVTPPLVGRAPGRRAGGRRARRPTRSPPEALGAVLTHTFASRLPGYVGWHWAVTVARVARRRRGHRRRGRAAARRRRRCWPRPGCRGTSGCAPATSRSATCCPPPRTTRGWRPPTPSTTTPPTTPRAASSPSSSGWAASG